MPALLTRHGRADDTLRRRVVGDALVAGDGAAAFLPDGRDHLVGDARPGPAAVDLAADVVHHDCGALRGEQLGDRAPDAAPRAGHDRRLAVEPSHPQASFGGAGFTSPSSTVVGARRSSSSSVQLPSAL